MTYKITSFLSPNSVMQLSVTNFDLTIQIISKLSIKTNVKGLNIHERQNMTEGKEGRKGKKKRVGRNVGV